MLCCRLGSVYKQDIMMHAAGVAQLGREIEAETL